MITLEKIDVYERYSGSSDGIILTGSEQERRIFDKGDWSLIDELIQKAFLSKKELASDEYARQIERMLRENCDSEEVVERLLMLADNLDS